MKSDLIKGVGFILEESGYTRLSPTFSVGSVSFDGLVGFLGGSGSLDLVLVLETDAGDSGRNASTRWAVERVARALDAAGSRRPLSAVIIADESIPTDMLDAMLRVSRVVTVIGDSDLAIQLAPLLPLETFASDQDEVDALEGLTPFIESKGDSAQFHKFVQDARISSIKVEERFSMWLESSFAQKEDDL